MGCATAQFFLPRPLGAGEGSVGQISLNFNNKSQFQRFSYQTLCVLSQIKDIKHMQQDFCSVAWVGLGGAVGAQGVNFFPEYIKLTGMTSRTECKYNFHPRVKLGTL